ncbi:hypothetical protein STEG23_015838, partial [Scotinomys teguina]
MSSGYSSLEEDAEDFFFTARTSFFRRAPPGKSRSGQPGQKPGPRAVLAAAVRSMAVARGDRASPQYGARCGVKGPESSLVYIVSPGYPGTMWRDPGVRGVPLQTFNPSTGGKIS